MNNHYLKGILCPICGNEDRFDIRASCTLTVTDAGPLYDSDFEWQGRSPICCCECGERGLVKDFAPPGFYVTFTTTTEASAEAGEAARHGWWDAGGHFIEDVFARPATPAFPFDPDAFDLPTDYDAAKIDWAVRVLKEQGARHPNTMPALHATRWSTEGNEVLDVATGETVQYTFHFHGFTDSQMEAVAIHLTAED